MPKLIGPTYEEHWPTRHPFWGRYKLTKGIALLVRGSTVTEATYPSQADLQDPNNPYDYIYMGGYTHTISQAEADVLIAAGYGAYIFPD